MRLLVCGDRDWYDPLPIEKRIGEIQPSVVIHGCAKGADSMAGRAARKFSIPVLEFPALWDKYGKGAGPIRNQQMLDEGKPDYVLAFHDDLEHSKGTRDMVNRAKKAGIPVEVWKHTRVQA